MTILTEDFLSDVRAEVATYIELSGIEGDSLAEDPVLTVACSIAFSQVEVAVNRPIIQSERIEIYRDRGERFNLAASPVDLDADIEVYDLRYKVVIPSENYIIYRNGGISFNYEDFTSLSFLYGDPEANFLEKRDFKVSYMGGFLIPQEDMSLFNALVTQAIAMYRRRDFLGIGYIQGKDLTTKVASDKGGLTETAALLVEHLKVYGDYENVG